MARASMVCVGIVFLAPSALAGPAEDCNQAKDVEVRIRGCTLYIRQPKDTRDAAGAYYNRGVAYYDKKDHDRALADFYTALQLNPRSAHPHLGLGSIYASRKDYDRAIEEYTKAARINPALPEAHRFLAWVLMGKN